MHIIEITKEVIGATIGLIVVLEWVLGLLGTKALYVRILIWLALWVLLFGLGIEFMTSAFTSLPSWNVSVKWILGIADLFFATIGVASLVQLAAELSVWMKQDDDWWF